MQTNNSKISIITVSVLIAAGMIHQGFAQTPQKISYQAVIRDASEEIIKGTQVGIRVTIISGPLPGAQVYQEIQTPVTSESGLVTLQIGGESGFDAINWGNNEYYIKTETDPAGGTNYTISSMSRILSVPFTLIAGRAKKLSGIFCYADKDGDGYGDSYSPMWIPGNVNVPGGFILNGEDCDDLVPSVHPGAVEICGDGIDQDCDGLVDENC